MSLEFIVQPIINAMPYLSHLGIAIYFIVFLVAAIESSPIGVFTPGTLLMLFFGFTVSQGYMEWGWCFVAGAVGATIGDILAYLLGKYGKKYLHEHKGILKVAHIEMGRAFFTKHGKKSILFGRFIGPIRPIVPLIAGSVGVAFRRFLLWNFLGASIWAFLYIYLGKTFGQYWKLIDKWFSNIGLLAFIVVVALIYYFVKNEQKKLTETEKSPLLSNKNSTNNTNKIL